MIDAYTFSSTTNLITFAVCHHKSSSWMGHTFARTSTSQTNIKDFVYGIFRGEFKFNSVSSLKMCNQTNRTIKPVRVRVPWTQTVDNFDIAFGEFLYRHCNSSLWIHRAYDVLQCLFIHEQAGLLTLRVIAKLLQFAYDRQTFFSLIKQFFDLHSGSCSSNVPNGPFRSYPALLKPVNRLSCLLCCHQKWLEWFRHRKSSLQFNVLGRIIQLVCSSLRKNFDES